MDEVEKIYYREDQRFSQIWLWMIIVIIAVLFTVGFVKQIVFKVPFGDRPMSDCALSVTWIISSIIMPGLLYWLRLITIVKSDGVYFRFTLLNRSFSKILFTNIRKYEARI
jgi:spore maturation protein SpmA